MRIHPLAKTVLAVALMITSSATLGAQQHHMNLPATESITVTAASGMPEIPFRLVNNHLIIELSVNGSSPIGVILDTGMPMAGLAIYDSPEVAALSLDIDPSIDAQIGGAGGAGGRRTAQVAMSETLTLPGVEIDGTPVIVMPAMPDFAGYHQGIIGYSLFSRFVVELDYDRQLLRLHDPASYVAAPGAHILQIRFENRLPYVDVTLSQEGHEPFSAPVVVDLGASHAISLNGGWSERIALPSRTITTVIGRGLSGPVNGDVGRLVALDLGGAALKEVIATYPVLEHQNPRGVDSLAGNLGSDVLRRFNTTFDYAGERLILVPNESFSEPFVFDRSGLRLRIGNGLVVESIVAGSPAAEAGIEVGDVLTHLEGRAVGTEDYSDVRAALMGQGAVRLVLERDSESSERELRLRTLI